MTIQLARSNRNSFDSLSNLINFGEHAFSFIAMTYFTGVHGPLVTYLVGESVSFTVGSLLRYLVLFTSFLLIVFRWRLSLDAARRVPLLWVFLSFVALSCLWSESPGWTFLSIRGGLLPAVMFALYFSSRFSLREQMRIFIFSFSVFCIGSLLAAFVLPELGRHPMSEFDGAWRGLFMEKNGLSAAMALTLLLFLCAFFGKEQPPIIPKPTALAGIILGQAMILLSTSMTGLILSVLFFLFLIVFIRFRWQGSRYIFFIDIGVIVSLFLLFLLVTYWDFIFTFIGRDPTLTGRTYIWQASIDYWLDRFWIGYGMDVFWLPQLPYAMSVSRVLGSIDPSTGEGYIVPHAHNGYLDMLLAVGFIGFLLFLLGLLRTVRRAFRFAYISRSSHLLWVASFLSFFTIFNFVESAILLRTPYHFLIYLCIYISLSMPERALNPEP